MKGGHRPDYLDLDLEEVFGVMEGPLDELRRRIGVFDQEPLLYLLNRVPPRISFS